MSQLFKYVLAGAALVATAGCSSMQMGGGTSSYLALSGDHYRPKYLPAAEVIQAKQTSGRLGSDTYVCADTGCQTAMRVD